MSRTMSGNDEGLAQRWSRLKQQAREEQAAAKEAPTPQVPAPAETPADATKAEDKKEEKPFDPASLPPVESLTNESDYSLFMRAEVPEDLRQKALRQLWATDPVLSAPEVFDMHNLDYNAVPTFPEGLRSLYRVGRGVIDAAEAEAEEAAEKAAAEKAARAAGSGPAESQEKNTDAQPQDAAVQHDRLTEIKDSGVEKA
jgi:Protein of unknown function (DUF3306)